MPNAIRCYVRLVDRLNRGVGRLVMYLIFAMMGLLLYASFARSVLNAPLLWGVEMSQFMLASYYLLGGAYAMQMGAHVRMDLFYSRWTPRTQAFVDAITILFLIVFLVTLLAGGISSTHYALEYGQRNYSSWAPPLAPIKIIMCIGILLMLLQAVATFFKDVAVARGKPLDREGDA
ncbi:TRAP transporter small permease subunit [Halomonas urumqiensis]|uniref:TRAP transporter small permease protein n=1 Tax=Halomonas urumqiensis TaxID=1684789 RepID=A0A2N7UMD8_9GAMM|nr:TRAP transporter small permease subunit [Halomonas urumqiensis]PMR81610.1 C4-dicarboxylate ABC transporter permease [Halomonas urumqiensis]PTB02247.1 C4-dicarboxylate ABC transporter permease [Halomonas urumqiensis]GHE21713.1 C4-dicarboxylate ABC transporter [Halomonas urumqiensis]